MGSPSATPLPSSSKASGRPVIGRPSVYTSVAPRKMVSPPRVAMNGARRAYPTNTPLNKPSKAPTTSAAIIASAGGHSATENPAASAPLKASTDPTERSIPPARITVVIPKASRALTEICRRTLIRFVVARKVGDSSDSATTRATRASDADQRMDLPGFQREIDALQGLYSAEALLDAAHLQKGHELS